MTPEVKEKLNFDQPIDHGLQSGDELEGDTDEGCRKRERLKWSPKMDKKHDPFSYKKNGRI